MVRVIKRCSLIILALVPFLLFVPAYIGAQLLFARFFFYLPIAVCLLFAGMGKKRLAIFFLLEGLLLFFLNYRPLPAQLAEANQSCHLKFSEGDLAGAERALIEIVEGGQQLQPIPAFEDVVPWIGGKVSFSRFKCKAQGILLARITDASFSNLKDIADTKLFLRRISTILRHEEDSVLVLLTSDLPARASPYAEFAFQSRLSSSTAVSPIKAAAGFSSVLFFSRGM